MTGFATAIGAFFAWLMLVPGGEQLVRLFMMTAMEFLFLRQEADPEYRRMFFELTAKLPGCKNPQEKRNVLQAIAALRPKKP